MKIISKFLQEQIDKPVTVPFVTHKHNPRSGSEHYDIRIIDPQDDKILHSFAAGTNLPEKIKTKLVLVKTKDHNPRWLDLDSYRLETYDKGKCIISKFFPNYWEVEFKGKHLKGKYKMLKLKTRRGDNWLLIKSS